MNRRADTSNDSAGISPWERDETERNETRERPKETQGNVLTEKRAKGRREFGECSKVAKNHRYMVRICV